MTTLVRRVIYSLKRRFGLKVEILYLISTSTNVETGKVTNVRGKRTVQKAILLPTKIHKEFAFDLAYIAASKNFTMGSTYTTSERKLIIDRRDLRDFEIKVGMWFVFEGKRYDVKQVEEFEHNAGYIITAEQDTAVAMENMYEGVADTTISVTQTGAGTL